MKNDAFDPIRFDKQLAWSHLDSDVDGSPLTIPAGVQSWTIAIVDANGPDPVVTMSNGARTVPAPVGELFGSTQEDCDSMSHTITVDPNGNRVYVIYSTLV